MSLEAILGDAFIDAFAGDVASTVLDTGAEFLSDGFVSSGSTFVPALTEQVDNLAGNSNWWDVNNTGTIVNNAPPVSDFNLSNSFLPQDGPVKFDAPFNVTPDSTFSSLSNPTDSLTRSLTPTTVNSLDSNLVSQTTPVTFDIQYGPNGQTIYSPQAAADIGATQARVLGPENVTIGGQYTPGAPDFVGPPVPAGSTVVNDATVVNNGVFRPGESTITGVQVNPDANTAAIPQAPVSTAANPTVNPAVVNSVVSALTGVNVDQVLALKNSPTPATASQVLGLVPGGQNFLSPTQTLTSPGLVPANLNQSLAPVGTAVNFVAAAAAPVADPNLATPPISTNTNNVSNLLTDAARTAALIQQGQNQQTARLQFQNQSQTYDWRVKLSLGPTSNYLYNEQMDPGSVLYPLYNTNGVIFPYTPSIDTVYRANYSAYDLTHSNYRGYFYQNSYVDAINIKATFTAQDTAEANYLLAVIHFFRSITKMFYGQDYQRGSPPPLTYLSGLGDYQFNNHPCLVQQFNYSLPADVNYIRAQNVANNGTNQITARNRQTVLGNPVTNALQRLLSLGQGVNPGAVPTPFAVQGSLANGNPTYVPSKMEINLTLLPVQSRSQVSQQFSLKAYANGNLLKGGYW